MVLQNNKTIISNPISLPLKRLLLGYGAVQSNTIIELKYRTLHLIRQGYVCILYFKAVYENDRLDHTHIQVEIAI